MEVPGVDSLTAVVVNFRTPDYTIRAARALVEDGLEPERVVVIDNGSEDESPARFASELPGFRLVNIERNVGFARAANRGAAELAGSAYVFVNNDAFVHRPGSVRLLLEALADDRVGIVVPRVLNEDLTLQPNVAPVHSPSVALARASGLSRLVPNRWQPRWSTHWDHLSSREIESASGAVVLARSEAWDDLGGFEESAFMFAEDLDLCWRARKLGWKVWFAHEAEFVHLGGSSTRTQWGTPERAERIGKAEAAMIRRHMSARRAGLTLAFMRAGLAARMLLRAALGNRAAAQALRGELRGLGTRS